MRVDGDCPPWRAALYFQIQALNRASRIGFIETMRMMVEAGAATDPRVEIVEIDGEYVLKTPGEIK